jgi:DNA-binding CsgD family transcriptional regulator
MESGLTQFLDRMQGYGDVDALQGALSDRLSEMGFSRFSYHMIRPFDGPRVPLVITNYPKDWARRYTDEDYVNLDPTISEAGRSCVPFRWSDVSGRRVTTAKQRRMMKEVAEFGLAQGGTVPVHGPGAALAAVSVASDRSSTEFDRLWAVHKHELHLIACYTHETVAKRLGPDSSKAFFQLSPRERECLLWAARGKTAWETSVILGTSERTVVFHFENATRKLGVHSKLHAVVKGIMMGLIVP